MDRYPNLQSILEGLLGSRDVYFQPPPSLKMAYPCIVYQRDNAATVHAGNLPYSYTQRYQVTLIAQDPDLNVRSKIAELPLSRYERFFAANNLNHDVFVVYF